jgi:hypothetical protein
MQVVVVSSGTVFNFFLKLLALQMLELARKVLIIVNFGHIETAWVCFCACKCLQMLVFRSN